MATRTTIHLIRHGDAVPPPDVPLESAAGYDAMPLSAKGRAQAAALGARLARTVRLDAVYASPTRRAVETAEAVAGPAALAVVRDARLRETGLGDESVGHVAPADRPAAILAHLTRLAETAVREGSWASVPGAEPAGEVVARIAAAVADIVRAHPEGEVALVSHAGTINAYLSDVLGTRRSFFYPIRTTSIATVRVEGDRTTLFRLNDCAHLEAALTP